MWIEMSRDNEHGGGDWGFTKCLWSPSRKENNSKWSHWETVLRTQTDDIVIHLRGEGGNASFVGYSTVSSNGFETDDRPPSPGQWGYSKSFYKAYLRDFQSFDKPFLLKEIFEQKDQQLRTYFEANKNSYNTRKLKLFYVVQSRNLQCFNGGYLSEVDQELAEIIFNTPHIPPSEFVEPSITYAEAKYREETRTLLIRIGQKTFSKNVRDNYGSECCFPGCPINESNFLIGSHIARWADEPELRGHVSNGLCLCLMHDKAFELGWFTISKDFRVWVDSTRTINSNWGKENLLPFHREQIRIGRVTPSEESLQMHRKRINLYPE
jgi:putative restriction endonuclease